MTQANKKLVIITRGELLRSDASVLLGNRIAALPPVQLMAEIDIVPSSPANYDSKVTHKSTEPKGKPRSYRFAESVEQELQRVTRKLGIENQTTFVEAAIRAACAKVKQQTKRK